MTLNGIMQRGTRRGAATLCAQKYPARLRLLFAPEAVYDDPNTAWYAGMIGCLPVFEALNRGDLQAALQEAERLKPAAMSASNPLANPFSQCLGDLYFNIGMLREAQSWYERISGPPGEVAFAWRWLRLSELMRGRAISQPPPPGKTLGQTRLDGIASYHFAGSRRTPAGSATVGGCRYSVGASSQRSSACPGRGLQAGGHRYLQGCRDARITRANQNHVCNCPGARRRS